MEGDNLFGDGVNIAARLEAIAPPGRICISGFSTFFAFKQCTEKYFQER